MADIPPAPSLEPPERPRDDDPPWPDHGPRHDAGEPEQAFQPGFSMLDAAAMVIWFFVAQVLVVAVAIGIGVDVADELSQVVVTVVMQLVALLGIATWARVRGVSSWRVLGPVRPRWRHAWIGIGLGIVGLLIVQVVAFIVNAAYPASEPPSQVLLESLGSSTSVTIAVVVASVVMAPLLEEVLYRSLVFQSTRARIGLPGALVISSLVFALHPELLNSLPALFGLLALGLWLAAIFHKTGSLVVPIVAHATYNAANVALALALASA